MATLRIGLLLPSRCGPGADGATPGDALALGVHAEALGFDSAWAGESILARPRHEPLTLLAALAASTERITLGTAVLLPALHAPLPLAQRLATLDLLARGRLVVGAGIGIDNEITRREFAAAGVPFEERVGRLVAAVSACRTLWSTEVEALADDAPGRHTPYWDLRGIALDPKPHRPGGPPFWIGSTLGRERSLERAGRIFDGWLPTAPDAGAQAAGWQRVDAARRAAGRHPAAVEPAVYLTVSLANDPRAAEAALAAYVEGYYGIPFEILRKVQGLFAGTPEQCAAWLDGYARAGARHLVLRCPDLAGQIDVLAGEVLPRLRSGTGAP